MNDPHFWWYVTRASAVLASAGYQPTAVYCATPTVLYEKHATAAAGVREAIAAHEAKQARRQT